MEYSFKRRIVRLGNSNHYSLVVSLPRVWTDANGLEAGTEVLVAFDDFPFLKIIPKDAKDLGAGPKSRSVERRAAESPTPQPPKDDRPNSTLGGRPHG